MEEKNHGAAAPQAAGPSEHEQACPTCGKFYPRWVTLQNRWDELFDEREDEIVHLRRVLFDIAAFANECATMPEHECSVSCMDKIAHLAGSALSHSRQTLPLILHDEVSVANAPKAPPEAVDSKSLEARAAAQGEEK